MTNRELKQLQSDGKIQNFTVHKRQQTFKDSDTKPRKELPTIPNAAKRSEEKGWLHWNLLYLCNKHGLELRDEYYFAKPLRDWHFDFYIETKNFKVGIEYEGIVSEKSRHTTITGYTGDAEKYNEAAKRRIIVLRYTALNYRNVIRDLKEILK